MSREYRFAPCFRLVVIGAFFFLALTNVQAEPQDDGTKVEGDRAGIAWKPATSDLLERETSSGRNVLLIFVADWCAPCQAYLKTTLKSERCQNVINEKRVTPLIADITMPSAEINALMKEFDVNAIPATFVFPAGAPEGPMRHVGTIGEEKLVNELKKLPVSMQPTIK